jgi:putative hydrolases of HD superfamily
MEHLDQQMRFVAEIGKLKAIRRQTVLAGSGLHRRENSAEHSWHLAVMAVVLAEHAPPGTDVGRVITMVLLHDLVEIDAGDLFAYASQAQHEQQEIAERAAADRIFALLPAGQGEELRQLWQEFTDRESADAKFARALDRLQPMLENMTAGGGTWREHGISASQVLEKVELIKDGSATLGGLAAGLVDDAVATGLLAPASGGSAEEDQLDRRDHADDDDDDPQRKRRQPAPRSRADQPADG